jgi:hypothetical protein
MKNADRDAHDQSGAGREIPFAMPISGTDPSAPSRITSACWRESPLLPAAEALWRIPDFYPMHKGLHLPLDFARELPVNEQPQDQVCA